MNSPPCLRAGLMVVALILALPVTAAAAAGEPQSTGGRVTFFPEDQPYDTYLADPWLHGLSINLMEVTDENIDQAGSSRQNLKIGGSFGFLRLNSSGWQFSIEAGFNAQADVDEGYDIIGWDGVAGLLATRKLPHGLSIRLSPYMHRSSHVGDEYIERTGRTRIEYTREEYTAGLSWNFLDHWRVYGDTGYAYTTRSPLQERWRAQGGAEWVHPHLIAGGRAGLYAAVNGMAWEETDWGVDISVAAGLLVRVNERDWRFGLLFHDGSVPIGEFFQTEETFIAFGIWLDL